ncbi:hypothetical protein D9Q98_005430 [Chlorella vulgaris]|uniref:ABC transporter domain-containing protein n=1 Tax=Chlorella vulgaris TaxID=3077 RepID=A0A9D4TM47_CHLVU|nr:hypothetical protein D9Q98_005430 [Chlorella vulgaris]
MDWHPGAEFRSFERVSVSTVDDDHCETQRAALERAFAKQLAAREVVLVAGKDGEWRAMKLRKLKAGDRQELMDKVFATPQDERQGFHMKVADRLAKAGVANITVEVRFKDLTVQGNQVIMPDSHVKGLAKLKKLNPFGPKKDIRPWRIIDGASGVLKPGRLTLLLGTPGSGRTLLLKALAGRLGQEKTLKVSSTELTYNGRSMDTFVPERTAHYISQLDDHFGELTVRQTLDFAARCHGGWQELLELVEAKEKELGITPDADVKSAMSAALVGGKRNLRVDIVLRTLGLDICADTLVGNHMIRGISGGQKKRVTLGEMTVGPSKVIFADEISTGLDSATTFDIVTGMREHARHSRSTQLIALLQPTPETIELFDDVMMLSAGKIIWQGPVSGVLPFFRGLGFACPPRRNVADFLQEVPMPGDQERFWTGERGAYSFVNSRALSEAFYATTEPGRAIVKELSAPFAGDSGPNLAIGESKYGAGYGELVRACLRRGLLLINVMKAIHIGRLMQVTFLGFCVSTLFLQEDKGLVNGSVEDGLTAANNFLGVIFFSLLTFMVGAFADSAIFVQSLPVWYKQRNAKFYPAACFALSSVVMRLPWIFTETWVWTLLVYFSVGFYTSVRIFAFWGTLFSLAVFSLTLYLACAALMRNVAAAVAVEATLLLVFVNVCGFVISKVNIPGGWNIVYWANPLTYMFTSVAVNEFSSPDWSDPVDPSIPNSQTIGSLALASRGYKQSYDYVWIAIFVWGFCGAILNFCACVFFLATLPAPKPPVLVTEEAFALQLSARTGAEDIDFDKAELQSSPRGDNKGDLEAQGGTAVPGQGSSLPFIPVRMTFKDIRYSVPYPKDAARPDPADGDEGPHASQLLLLKGITGSFRGGVLTALMGASGAGKTTLMDVLAGRKTGGLITGEVTVNGFPQEPRTFARIMGYVEQTDIHVPHTTVEEALQFSARLRLPNSVSAEQADAFVHEVMDLVELAPIRNSIVGTPGVGLSVEQRKRLTIGVELVANPSIVFMDEPTSGLDARAAGVVMRAVKNTVATGRAVVCTIHQPSMEIFEAFDELLLLRRGGDTVFQGKIGVDSSDLIQYFSSISGTAPIKQGVNAANWMLEVTSPDAEKTSGHDFAKLYRSSELAQAVDKTVNECAQPTPGTEALKLEDLRGPGVAVQYRQLLLRNSRELVRTFTYNGIRTVITLACATIFATLFENQGSNVETYLGVLNVAGSMYSGVIFIGVVFCFQVQDPIGRRRTVFYREHAAGTYGVFSYWSSEFVAEVPWLVLFSIIYSVILYFSIGFINDAGKFFFYFLIMLLNLMSFTAFGMLVVHATPQLEAANALAGTIFALYNLFCGFIKPQPLIPAGWIWFHYFDPVSFSLYGLIASQLGDVTTLTELPSGKSVFVKDYIETYFGFKHSFMWPAAAILFGFMIFYHVLAFVALKKLNFQRR